MLTWGFWGAGTLLCAQAIFMANLPTQRRVTVSHQHELVRAANAEPHACTLLLHRPLAFSRCPNRPGEGVPADELARAANAETTHLRSCPTRQVFTADWSRLTRCHVAGGRARPGSDAGTSHPTPPRSRRSPCCSPLPSDGDTCPRGWAILRTTNATLHCLALPRTCVDEG